eukprot:1974797-Alexandrium_andersonii.AAC.1
MLLHTILQDTPQRAATDCGRPLTRTGQRQCRAAKRQRYTHAPPKGPGVSRSCPRSPCLASTCGRRFSKGGQACLHFHCQARG